MVDIRDILQERLEACQQQYALHFAGQLRLTRHPEILTALAHEARSIAEQSQADKALRATALSAADTYQKEYDIIVAEQTQAGATQRMLAMLTQRWQILTHRYKRHFAGLPRLDRDLSLLHELLVDVDACLAELHKLPPDAVLWLHTQLSDFQDRLQAESAAIASERLAGTLLQQAAAHAAAANTLLKTFEKLLVGRRALACRPELLQRLQQELQNLYQVCQDLAAAGLQTPHHLESLQRMAAQLTAWQQEQDFLLQLHANATQEAIAKALADELAQVLSDYNEHIESGRKLDVAGIGHLCDRLDELEKQLQDLPHQLADRLVSQDALVMLLSQYDLVQTL